MVEGGAVGDGRQSSESECELSEHLGVIVGGIFEMIVVCESLLRLERE